MDVLIELYDRKRPYNNFLACTLLRPDKLIMLVPEEEKDQALSEERFANLKKVYKLHTEVVFTKCRTSDYLGTLDILLQAITEYGAANCVIDTNGGNETLLMAAGACIGEFPEIRIIGTRDTRLVWVWGPRSGEPIRRDPIDLNVKDVISIAAGELQSHGHSDRDQISDFFRASIPDIFAIYMRNRESWTDFTVYLQHLCTSDYKFRPRAFKGPAEFLVNPRTNKTVSPVNAILQDLYKAQVVTNFAISRDTCMVEFACSEIIEHLCITGSMVELYVFLVMEQSNYFSDVEIDPIISWDNDEDDDDTTNEVDIIAVKGIVPVFISCKSGKTCSEALNEILAITNRFGNDSAKAVLVTGSRLGADSPSVLKRAADSGVTIIDNQDLTPEGIMKRLKKLFPGEAPAAPH